LICFGSTNKRKQKKVRAAFGGKRNFWFKLGINGQFLEQLETKISVEL